MIFLSGCQIGYLFHVSYNHLALLNSKEPIDQVLLYKKLNPEQERKVLLTQEARQFAFNKLGLTRSNNYTDYVDLRRPYVTYAVMASQKWTLEPYLWTFPFIGKAPYKGYYNEEAARQEAEELKKQNLDVYVRGVSAFSTLGKLNDPLLSSMLNYSDYNLVNTIIHELVHTTLFIKDNIDFNERLAVFIAGKGTELFYLEKEGSQSKTLEKTKKENEDDVLFSSFITNELNLLKTWYKNLAPNFKNKPDAEQLRQTRLNEIKTHFKDELQPKLKTASYKYFLTAQLNNATLSNYHTYMKNLDIFNKAFEKSGSQIAKFLEQCKQLEKSDNPEDDLLKMSQ